jgi:hypothetical protein
MNKLRKFLCIFSDQIMDNKRGGACNTQRFDERNAKFRPEYLKGREHLEDLDLDGR